jgi:hypothetical protein
MARKMSTEDELTEIGSIREGDVTSNGHQKLDSVQLQLVLELERSLVNEFRKLITSYVISVYIYTVCGVELNCYKIPRGSAIGE